MMVPDPKEPSKMVCALNILRYVYDDKCCRGNTRVAFVCGQDKEMGRGLIMRGLHRCE